MFKCTACKPSNPATSTVKVDPKLIANGADKENVNEQQSAAEMERQQREEREKQEREREARERKAREVAEQREAERREQERREKERREAEEKAAEAERQRRQKEAERERQAAAAEERRRLEEREAQERREREQKEQERKQKEQEDLQKLHEFLASKGYGEDVNAKRKTFRKHYYPLHDAVVSEDAELIRIMLAAGADPSLKSSSGKTALDRANKRNVDGHLDPVCSLLQDAKPIEAH